MANQANFTGVMYTSAWISFIHDRYELDLNCYGQPKSRGAPPRRTTAAQDSRTCDVSMRGLIHSKNSIGPQRANRASTRDSRVDVRLAWLVFLEKVTRLHSCCWTLTCKFEVDFTVIQGFRYLVPCIRIHLHGTSWCALTLRIDDLLVLIGLLLVRCTQLSPGLRSHVPVELLLVPEAPGRN